MTGTVDWHAADRAYQRHHGACSHCRAAGMAPGQRERCAEGQALGAAYLQAGNPPHFTWLRPTRAAGKLNKPAASGLSF